MNKSINLDSIDPKIKEKYNLEERWNDFYDILLKGAERAAKDKIKENKEVS